jgi:hypothetical protein
MSPTALLPCTSRAVINIIRTELLRTPGPGPILLLVLLAKAPALLTRPPAPLMVRPPAFPVSLSPPLRSVIIVSMALSTRVLLLQNAGWVKHAANATRSHRIAAAVGHRCHTRHRRSGRHRRSAWQHRYRHGYRCQHRHRWYQCRCRCRSRCCTFAPVSLHMSFGGQDFAQSLSVGQVRGGTGVEHECVLRLTRR